MEETSLEHKYVLLKVVFVHGKTRVSEWWKNLNGRKSTKHIQTYYRASFSDSFQRDHLPKYHI